MAKVGMKDIAAEAGVSIATVSHAFRNPDRVSDGTRRKVLAAARRVGYTPNRLGASLRTARSGNIVVIIPDVADSHNARLIVGIERIAHEKGYSVLLGNTRGSAAREREFAAMARSRQADGIILMSHRLPFDAAGADELPPLVNGCEFTGQAGIPCVAIDDRAAGADATRHLLALGHREIAVITGDMASTSSRKRLEGFRAAVAEAGLAVGDDRIVFADYTTESGAEATRELLLHRDRPTAIFCFSDEIAIGCMHALRGQGFAVPRDMSVIGIDDIEFARYANPPLTTVAQPTEEIGARCARILFDIMDGERPGQWVHILPHELVVRESTAPPPEP
jgi:LacI family transcriptional regulator, repressor for deo operon, udp, cdd, tsx, nupC, and nupG